MKKEQRKANPQKMKLLGRGLWIALLLLFFLLIGVGLLLKNPQWLSPLIENRLSQQDIKTTISNLDTDFGTTTYRLQGDVVVSSPQYGIDMPQSQFDVIVDWWDLIRGKPFVNQVSLSDVALTLSPEKLKQLKKYVKADEQRRDISRYLPHHWQLKNTTVTIYEQPLTIVGHGMSDSQAQLILKDSQNGRLKLDYDKSSAYLRAFSQRLDLQAFTGVRAVLRDFSAEINTQAWLGSRVTSSLDYQGISARIQIDSENPTDIDNITDTTDEALGAKVHVQADNQSLTVWLTQKEEQITARVHEADLSVVSVLTPILPRKLRFKNTQGKVSGSAIFTQKKGIEKASLAFQGATIFHEYGGLGNINATLIFDREKVRFFSRLTKSPVFLPTVFPNGFSPLTGIVEGDFQLANQQLILSQVTVKNVDVESIKGKATIGLKEKFIDITATVEQGNAAKTGDYLPEQLPLSVRKWLKKAIISGTATQANVKIKGHYPEFIYRPDTVLKISADLQDTRLHYLKDNPDIIVKTGKLIIDGRKIIVKAPKAEIFTIVQGKRQAVPLSADALIKDYLNAVVNVDAHIADQPLLKLYPLTQASLAEPVLKQIDGIVRAKGRMSVKLGLVIGVSKENHKKDFKIALNSPSLEAQLVEFPKIQLKQAKLNVQANQDGLQTLFIKQAKDSNGKLMNISIDRDKAKHYRADVQANVDTLSLLSKLNILSPEQYQFLQKQTLVRGISPAKAQLLFDKNGKFQQVSAESDLQGTTISLFKLLTKAGQTRLPMTMSYRASEKKLSLNLQKRLNLVLGFSKDGSLSGLLVDNLRTRKFYQIGKKQVYYHAPSFDFFAFNQFRQQLEKYWKTQSKTTTDFSKDLFDIDIRQVDWDKNTQTPLIAKGSLANLVVNSPLVAGKIQYRPNQLNAQLSQIDISKLSDLFGSKETESVDQTKRMLPFKKMLPAMQIQADKVYFAGNEIGKATIRSSIKNGLCGINQFLLSGKHFFFELSGYEKKEPYGLTSRLQLDFKGERIRKIAKLFKLNPVIDGKFIDFSANLSWPGKIHVLDVSKIYGDAKLKAQNIKLTTVQAGAGSLFGLMDIVGILKRITLDFKNLSSSKISFDTVEGRWNIGGGRAVTKNMAAEGSLVDLKLSGALDIYRRTFDDVDMLVIPKASNVIPIVGAVAGGVVGGAIGVFVQQVMGDSINQAVGIPYVLSGQWENPGIMSLQDKNKQKDKQQSQPQKAPSMTLETLVRQGEENHTIELKQIPPTSQFDINHQPQDIELESIDPSDLILESAE